MCLQINSTGVKKGILDRGQAGRAGGSEPDSMAMSATERALNLFQALDVNADGLLTMEEFIAGG